MCDTYIISVIHTYVYGPMYHTYIYILEIFLICNMEQFDRCNMAIMSILHMDDIYMCDTYIYIHMYMAPIMYVSHIYI